MKRPKEKAKTPQTTTRMKKAAKTHYQETDAYQKLHILRKIPTRKEYITKVATDLIEWAVEEETADTLKAFYAIHGIPIETITTWKKRHLFLAKAIQFAKMAIGVRRERGGMSRTKDPNFMFKSMPIYDEDYKKLREWESHLKTEEAKADNRGTVYVIKNTVEELKERAKK